jgi:hypothetical protein
MGAVLVDGRAYAVEHVAVAPPPEQIVLLAALEDMKQRLERLTAAGQAGDTETQRRRWIEVLHTIAMGLVNTDAFPSHLLHDLRAMRAALIDLERGVQHEALKRAIPAGLEKGGGGRTSWLDLGFRGWVAGATEIYLKQNTAKKVDEGCKHVAALLRRYPGAEAELGRSTSWKQVKKWRERFSGAPDPECNGCFTFGVALDRYGREPSMEIGELFAEIFGPPPAHIPDPSLEGAD